MAYWDIAQMAMDADLIARSQASAAQELPAAENPYSWTADHMLNLAAQPGWADSWASAVASSVPNPGRDPGVITDGMILSAVQTVMGAI